MPRSEFDFTQQPVRFSELYLTQRYKDETGVSPFGKRMEDTWKYLQEELPYDPLGVGDWSRGRQYNADLIPYEDGYAFGVLPANIATSMAFAEDYHRGIFTYNQAHSNLVAKRITRGRKSLTEDKMSRLTPDTSNFLKRFLATKSNWAKGFKGNSWRDIGRQVDIGSGFGWSMFSQPEDLFEVKQPGYSQDQTLDIIEDTNEGHYSYLMLRFGGREGLKEITKEANNSDHFFYLLNEAIDHESVRSAIEYHTSTMEGVEEFWKLTAWPFLRDGLFNDPDMPASMVIGLGTAGIGTLVGAAATGVFATGTLLSKAPLIGGIGKWTITGAKGLSHGTKVGRIVNYLPENIGLTVFNKVAPTLGNSMMKAKGIKGLLYRSPAHGFEGLVEGALAESINQTLKQKRNIIDQYNFGQIWEEAKIEGIFSMIANPVLGTTMKYAVGLPLTGLGMAAGASIKHLPIGERLRSSLHLAMKAAQMGSDNPILVAIEHYEKGDAIVDLINEIRSQSQTEEGGPISLEDLINGPLGFLLDPFGMRDGVNTLDDVSLMISIFEEIKADSENRKLTDDQILDQVGLKLMTRLGEGGKALAAEVGDLTAFAKIKLRVHRYVIAQNKKNKTNLTVDEFLENTDITDEELWDIYIDKDIEERVSVRMKKDGKDFSEATAREKLDVLQVMEDEVMKQFRDKQKNLIVRVNENRQQKAAIGDAVAATVSDLENVSKDSLLSRWIKRFKAKGRLKKIKLATKEREAKELRESKKAKKIINRQTAAQKKTEGIKKFLNSILKQGFFVVAPNGKVKSKGKGTKIEFDKDEIKTIQDLLGMDEMAGLNKALGDAHKAVSKAKQGLNELGITVQESLPEPPSSSDQVIELEQDKEDLKSLRQGLKNQHSKETDPKNRAKIEKHVEDIDNLLDSIEISLEEWKEVAKDNEELQDVREKIKSRVAKVKELNKKIKKLIGDNAKIREARDSINFLEPEFFEKLTEDEIKPYHKKGKIRKEDLTAEQWQALIDAISIWVPAKFNFLIKGQLENQIKKGEIKLSDVAKLKNGLIGQENVVFKKIEATEEYKEMQKLEEELKVLDRKKEGIQLRLALDNAKIFGLASFQLRTITEALDYRNKKLKNIEHRRNALKRRWEKHDKITADTLKKAYMSFDGRASDSLQDVDPKHEYNQEEAEEIFEKEAKKQETAIKRIKPGYFRSIDWKHTAKHPRSASEWGVNNTTETPLIDRTNEIAAEETLINKEAIARGDTDGMAFTLAEELMALGEFNAQLVSTMEGPWADENNGVVPIWVVDSNLPAGIFDTSIPYFFRDAIVDEDGNSIPENITSDDLELQYDTLYVDLSILITAISRRIMIANDDFKDIANESLDSLIKKLKDTSKPKGRKGIYTALALTERLMKASRAVERDLFRQHGFLLSMDRNTKSPVLSTTIKVELDETGEPINADAMAEAEQEFIRRVKKGMIRGIKNTIETRPGWRKRIFAYFNIPEEVTDPKAIAEYIYKGLDSKESEEGGFNITEEDIIDMGNGKKGWVAANELGKQLIDFVLVNHIKVKEPVTKRNLTVTGGRELPSEAQTETSQEGEAVRTEPMMVGESTSFAPERPEVVALVWEDFLTRKRFEFILNDELDDKTIEEYTKWRHERITTSDKPLPTALNLDPEIRVLPSILNLDLDQTIITRDELAGVLIEVLLELPNMAYAFIHDSRYSNWALVYTDEAGHKTVHTDITTGDPTIVPLSNISSVLALEQMSNLLHGLTMDVIDQGIALEKDFAAKHIEDFGENYWDNPEFWDKILDPRTYLDKKFNGLFVTKVLSLTSEKASKAMEELRKGTNMHFDVPDYYVKAGLHFSKHIRSMAKENNNYEILQPFVDFYDKLEQLGITTHEEYEAYMKENKDSDPDYVRLMKTMRDFWKLPVMRTLYSGSYPMWIKLWKEGGDGFKKIMPLFKEMGFKINEDIKIEGIPAALAMFGDVLFRQRDSENMIIIHAALGLENKVEEVKEILSMDEEWNEGHLQEWTNTVRRWTHTELSEDNQTKRRDYLRRQLNLNISMIAKMEGRTVAEQRIYNSDVNSRITRAEDIVKKAEAEGREITDEEDDNIRTILSGEKMSWKHNQLFFALNMVNASGFKIAVKVLKAQAASTGMRFHEEDLLGFQNFILYQVFLPGLESHRSYSTRSSMNRHHHNTMFARIQTNTDAFESFIENEVTEEDWMNPSKLGKKIIEWAEEPYEVRNGERVIVPLEGESPLGQWNTLDNPHQQVTITQDDGTQITRQVDPDNKEEFDAWEKKAKKTVERLMIRNEMLQMAVDDAPQVSKYTKEDDIDELEAEFMDTWFNHSEEAAIDWASAIKFQQDATRDDHGKPIETSVSMFEKGSGLAVPIHGKTIRFRGAGERTAREIQFGSEDSVAEATDKPRGFLSWVPQTRMIPYHNKGNLLLQHKTYKGIEKEFMRPIDEAREALEQPLENPDHIIPVSARGFVKPWDRSTLPMGPPLTVDPLDYITGIETDTPNMVAGVIEMQLARWATQNGFEAELQDPDNIPYLYLVYKLDRILDDEIEQIIRSVRFGDKKLSTNTRLLQARNAYLTRFHEIFQLPRDIRMKEIHSLLLETRGNEIGILNPDMEGMTLGEILTSIFSENNLLGHLSTPTLAHDALKFGLVPGEHFIIKEGINPGEKILEEETRVFPLIIQSTDQPEYLVGALWDQYIFKAIEEYLEIVSEERRTYIKQIIKEKHKRAWNHIPPQDRKPIIEIAQRIASKAHDPIVHFAFTAEPVEGRDDLVRLVDMNITEKEETSGKMYRNPFGGAFSMLMTVPRTVVGANLKLGITPAGALLMLAAHNNQPLYERAQTAYHTGKQRRGVIIDGKYQKIQSESEELDEYFGYSMQQQLNKARIESDAIDIVVDRAKEGAKIKHRLVDGSRSVGNVAPTIVNWLNYYRGEADDGALNLPFFINAHVAPIRRSLSRLEASGLANLIINASPASEKKGFSSNIVDKTKETLVALGMSEENASKVISIQQDPNWLNKDSDILSLDIETTLDGKREIVGVGGISKDKIVGGHITFKGGGMYSPKGRGISQTEAHSILTLLEQHLLEGGVVVTYNGNNFDFRRLGAIAGDMKLAQRVAELSIDLMQNIMVGDGKFSDSAVTQSLVTKLVHIASALELPPKVGSGIFAALLKKKSEGKEVTISDVSDLFLRETGRRPLDDFEKDRLVINIEKLNKISVSEAIKEYNKYVLYDADLNIQILKKLLHDGNIKKVERTSNANRESGGEASINVKTIRPTWNITNPHNTIHNYALNRGLSRMQEVTSVKETHIEIHSTKQPKKKYSIRELVEEVLNNTTSVLTDGDTQVGMILGLLLRQPDLKLNEVKAFFPLFLDKSAVEKKVFDNNLAVSYAKAKGIARRINSLLEAPSGEFHNSFYWDARLFVEQVADNEIGISTDILTDFFVWIQLKYETLGFDEKIKAEAEAALASVTEEFSFARQPDLLSEVQVVSRDLRNHENFSLRFPELSKISNNIDGAVKKGIISERHARMMRSALVKAWSYNPEIINYLNLDFVTSVEDSYAQKVGKTEYVIRIGNQLINPKDGISVAYMFAHELAHIGRIKFIEDHGQLYREWRTLFLSSRGKTLAKKVITAFHNGVWNDAAKKEYKKVMDDKSGEEFIAMLTGYYLLNDSLDLITLLEGNIDEAEVDMLDKANTIIEKIMGFVRRTMDRISSVFTEFKSLEPEEFERVTALIQNTLGWDEKAKDNLKRLSDVGNRPTRKLYLEDDKTDPVKESEDEKALSSIVDRIDEIEVRLEEINNQINYDLTGGPDANKELVADLDEEAENLRLERYDFEAEIERLGGNKEDPLGFTKVEFVTGWAALERKYSSTNYDTDKFGTKQIEVRDIIEGTQREKRLVLSYLLRQMTLMMHGNNGEFFANSLAAMENLPFFDKPGGFFAKLKFRFRELATGSTESSATWNSPFTLLVMLSTLVDNSMSTMAGHWGNVGGVPHVVGAVGQVDQLAKEIRTGMEVIERKITGFWESHVRFSKLSGNSSTLELVRDQVAKDIWKKVENPDHPYESDLLVGDEEMRKEADNIIVLYTNLMKLINEWGVTSGRIDRPFHQMIPMRFATGKRINMESTYTSFSSEMTDSIYSQIKKSRNEKNLDRRRIEPFTLYAMKELPHLEDPVEGLKELKNIKKNNPMLWKEIMAIAVLKQRLDQSRFKHLENIQDEIQAIKDSGIHETLLENLDEHSREEIYNDYIIPAVIDLMKFMSYHTNRYSAKYLGFGERKSNWWNRYYDSSNKTSSRLEIFEANTKDGRLTKSKLIEGADPHTIVGGTPEITTPASVYTANIVVGAGSNVYFSNQWAVPPISSIIDNPGIANMLVWSPETLADGIMRHVGQAIAEQSMYMDKFNFKATTGDILTIVRAALANGDLKNSDGSNIALKDRDMIVRSIGVLDTKYKAVLGKNETNVDRADQTLNFITKYAPDVTRIVFGTNLTLATIIVENTMNIINNLLGRGSISGTMISVVAPFLQLSPNVRKAVARDMAEIIRVFNEGRIPDFARPDIDARTTFAQRAPQWLGERNLHLAERIHEMIAVARSVVFRGWLKDATKGGSNSKLVNFLKLQKETNAQSRKEISKLMKRVGLPGTDAANIMYLMSEGALTEGNVDILVEMVNSTDEYYSLGDLLVQTNTKYLVTDEEFKPRLEVIYGLRRAEKRFIHEILVDPNPFDTNTGNSSWDHFFETFRRYPVLFSAQQVGRSFPRFSLARNAQHLLSYAIADSMYMTLLLVAAGYPLEDIMEGWKKHPTKQAMFMMARLPHFGRYIGLILEAIVGLASGFQRQPFGFIPVGAMGSFMHNIKKAITGLTDNDKEIPWSALMMILRIFPVIGDAITRTIAFNVLGEDFQRQNTMNLKKSSRPQDKWANYGSIYESSNVAQHSAIIREFMKELGWTGSKFHELPIALQKSTRALAAKTGLTPPEEPQLQPVTGVPTEPQRAPVIAPRERDIVGSIVDSGKPPAAPEGLFR